MSVQIQESVSVGIPNSKEVQQFLFTHFTLPIASRIVPTPRWQEWQELGPTCLLQLLVPEPSDQPAISETFETVRTHQNPSKPGTPKPSKPQPLSEPRNHRNTEAPKPSKPRQLSKPGERNLLNLEPSQDLTIENRNHFLEPVPEPWDLTIHRNLEPVPGTALFLPGTAPVEIYVAQRPHSIILLLGNNFFFSSLHANSPRHNLSLEISGERQGAGAVQMVQLQLLSFCKLLGGKASMVRLQGVGELVEQSSTWGRPLIPSNATLLKLMELRDHTKFTK